MVIELCDIYIVAIHMTFSRCTTHKIIIYCYVHSWSYTVYYKLFKVKMFCGFILYYNSLENICGCMVVLCGQTPLQWHYCYFTGKVSGLPINLKFLSCQICKLLYAVLRWPSGYNCNFALNVHHKLKCLHALLDKQEQLFSTGVYTATSGPITAYISIASTSVLLMRSIEFY